MGQSDCLNCFLTNAEVLMDVINSKEYVTNRWTIFKHL